MFRKYHYLNTELHTAARQYVAVIGSEIVAHTGVIQFPLKKGKKRVHRLVVLPDYQGIGVGVAFINAVAKMVEAEGFELNLTTTTPALVGALRRSKEWTLARYGREKDGMKGYQRYERSGVKTNHLMNSVSTRRITYSFWHKGTQ